MGKNSSFMIVLMLLLLLTGCQGEDSNTPITENPTGQQVGPEQQEEKPDFVIYRPPFTNDWLNNALARFNLRYRNELNIVFEDFSTENPTEEIYTVYQDRLKVELMAGRGPDVVFSQIGFQRRMDMDFNKAMKNQIFLDLKPYFEQDEDFHKGDYWSNIFDAGCYDGKQYIVPLTVDIPIFYSNTSKLSEIGIGNVEDSSTAAFLKQLSEAAVVAKQNPAFLQMMFVMNEQDWFIQFCQTANFELYDYSSNTICPNEELLRDFFEAYKLYYPYDTGNNEFMNLTLLKTPLSESIYFEKVLAPASAVAEAAVLKTYGGYTISSPRDSTGSIVASYDEMAAVRANTKNSDYAYQFIKIMLSSEIQGTASISMPVNKQAFMDVCKERRDYFTTGRMSGGIVYTQLTEDELQNIFTLFDKIDKSNLGDLTLYKMAWECMEPFFKNERGYEACYDELKIKLRLYIDE